MKNFIVSVLAFFATLFVADLMPVLDAKTFIIAVSIYTVVGGLALTYLADVFDVFERDKGGPARMVYQAIVMTGIVVFASTITSHVSMIEARDTYLALSYGPVSQLALALLFMVAAAVMVFMLVSYAVLAFADTERSAETDGI